jgi:hypothetical protein
MRQTYSLALVLHTSTVHDSAFKRIYDRLVNGSTLQLVLEEAFPDN